MILATNRRKTCLISSLVASGYSQNLVVVPKVLQVLHLVIDFGLKPVYLHHPSHLGNWDAFGLNRRRSRNESLCHTFRYPS